MLYLSIPILVSNISNIFFFQYPTLFKQLPNIIFNLLVRLFSCELLYNVEMEPVTPAARIVKLKLSKHFTLYSMSK